MREWNVYRSTRQTCVERTDVIVCGRRSSDMKLAKAIDTTTNIANPNPNPAPNRNPNPN